MSKLTPSEKDFVRDVLVDFYPAYGPGAVTEYLHRHGIQLSRTQVCGLASAWKIRVDRSIRRNAPERIPDGVVPLGEIRKLALCKPWI